MNNYLEEAIESKSISAKKAQASLNNVWQYKIIFGQ